MTWISSFVWGGVDRAVPLSGIPGLTDEFSFPALDAGPKKQLRNR